MNHFPIFLNTAGRRVVVSGGGAAALAKLRLLMKTSAHLIVFSKQPDNQIRKWADAGKLTLISRAMEPGDALSAALFYAADEDEFEDKRTANIAKKDGALVNIVDNLADSQFITPAIVDRDPVTVAIGTEGAAPVLARAIKADIEEKLPGSLGTLAQIGKAFRTAADMLPLGRDRRDFWRDYYYGVGPKAMTEGVDAVQPALDALLTDHLMKDTPKGHVTFVGAGPGDPELLTLKARRALDEADVVIYDRLISSEILELARREATMIDVGKEAFGPATPQEVINDLIVEHGLTGAQVVRLKSGDATVFGRLDEEIDAATAADINWNIIPGITSASAAAASIGQSLTKRGRNSSVRFLTGHDMKGFADHDWKTLAKPGEVAAVYMGKKSARYIQGRLLMHGADPATAVTVIENASRIDQRVLSTTVGDMEPTITQAGMSGPALTFIGLSPRAALTEHSHIPEQIVHLAQEVHT